MITTRCPPRGPKLSWPPGFLDLSVSCSCFSKLSITNYANYQFPHPPLFCLIFSHFYSNQKGYSLCLNPTNETANTRTNLSPPRNSKLFLVGPAARSLPPVPPVVRNLPPTG